MKDIMLSMLVEKHKSSIDVNQLVENDCSRYSKSLSTLEVILDEFRNQFPELCAPEISAALRYLENSRDDIRRARHRQGRVPDSQYSKWSYSINKAIEIFRLSSIQLPEINEDHLTE